MNMKRPVHQTEQGREKRNKSIAENPQFDETYLLQFDEPALQPNAEVFNPQPMEDRFKVLNPIQEGSYGVVSKAREVNTGKLVALKRFKQSSNVQEGFSISGLREIAALKTLRHENIVYLAGVHVETGVSRGSSEYSTDSSASHAAKQSSDDRSNDRSNNDPSPIPIINSVYIALEYVENDLRAVLRNMPSRFGESAIKTITWQILSATDYLHDTWYVHRDICPSNILLNNRGQIKLADFGLCRKYGDRHAMLTRLVVTMYYRAPELLVLGIQSDQPYCDFDSYGPAVDIWSIGCLLAELCSQKVMFRGSSETDQLTKIVSWASNKPVNSLPDMQQLADIARSGRSSLSISLPCLTGSGTDLLADLLSVDPYSRCTAAAALDHQWFNQRPYPLRPDEFPVFPVYS